MPLSSNQVLQGRYIIRSLLGQDGMGSVYRAQDQTLNRIVAIKERVPDPNEPAQGLAQARAQFQREAQILAGLSHPNLPHTYGYFSSGGNEYVAMELIEGSSLDQVVQQHGAINEGAVLAWANQILDALIYVHSRNVVHRDIKPANIILQSDGRAVLVDFGLVKLIGPSNPRTATAMRGMGTAEYAPLEQFSPGMHTDARSDIYSFGAILYHLLAGRPPLDVPARMLNPAQQPALRALNPKISTNTQSAVEKAMEIYPNNRFQSAVELKRALASRTTTAPSSQPTAAMPAQPTYQPTVSIPLSPAPTKSAAPVNSPVPLPQAHSSPVPARRTARGINGWTWLGIVASVGFFVCLAVGNLLGFGHVSLAPTIAPPTIQIQTARRGNDNTKMVYVPAGDFQMGSNDSDPQAGDDEKPQHTVYLNAFWMDKYLVTNALYEKCADTGNCPPPSNTSSSTRKSYYSNSQFDNYPVIWVSWNDAKRYCTWTGKHLPLEAEWEKTARGTDGRIYPWGNAFDQNLLNSKESNRGDTTPVDSFPSGASPYGALDMAGNVWEWVADWYRPNYRGNAPSNNPTITSSSQYKVPRGGSWDDTSIYVRAAYRFGTFPDYRYYSIGFRCSQAP